MTDPLTPQQRHRCMSSIKSRDTKPELVVRKWLWAQGYRYRLCIKGWPGKPDIVIRRLKTVIFVNGCFWHGHNVKVVGTANGDCGVVELADSDCCRIPRTNREFWLAKIERNRLRDYRDYRIYHLHGWHVLVVWECMLKPQRRAATLAALSLRLNDIFLASVRRPRPYQQPEPSHLLAAEPAPEYGRD